MHYEELYNELGKLFYLVAASDGKVAKEEKEKLTQLIQETWEPMEGSIDQFGTDKANYIGFAFDFAEEFGLEDYLNEFKIYFNTNKDAFTPQLKKNILATSRKIAGAYKGKNKDEKKLLSQIEDLLLN